MTTVRFRLRPAIPLALAACLLAAVPALATNGPAHDPRPAIAEAQEDLQELVLVLEAAAGGSPALIEGDLLLCPVCRLFNAASWQGAKDRYPDFALVEDGAAAPHDELHRTRRQIEWALRVGARDEAMDMLDDSLLPTWVELSILLGAAWDARPTWVRAPHYQPRANRTSE